MTKRENYLAIRAIVADNAELCAFIDHEIDLLNKKNSAKSDKPTAKQVANKELAGKVYNAIVMANAPQTCAVLADTFGVSGQKMSAILKTLVDDNMVIRTVEKRVPYFSKA